MRTSILLAACLTASLAGCAPAPCPVPAEPAPGGVLRGQVRDAAGKPVAGAMVQAADATGAAIPGTMRARTDDQGMWWVAQLPPGFTYVMVARLPGPGGPLLSTLARPSEGATSRPTDLSVATTVLTVAVMQGRSGMPGSVSPDNQDRCVALIEQALAGKNAPELTDAKAVAAWLSEQGGGNPELAGAVAQLTKEAGEGGSRDQVEAQVGARQSDPLDALKPIY